MDYEKAWKQLKEKTEAEFISCKRMQASLGAEIASDLLCEMAEIENNLTSIDRDASAR